MSTINSSPFMSPSLIGSVRTKVDAGTASSRGAGSELGNRNAWQHLIDYKLIEWGRDTQQFKHEDVEPPTCETVQLAVTLAEQLRDLGWAAPDTVVPDANGGIVFERRGADEVDVVHIWDDGMIEVQRFRGTRLIERQRLL